MNFQMEVEPQTMFCGLRWQHGFLEMVVDCYGSFGVLSEPTSRYSCLCVVPYHIVSRDSFRRFTFKRTWFSDWTRGPIAVTPAPSPLQSSLSFWKLFAIWEPSFSPTGSALAVACVRRELSSKEEQELGYWEIICPLHGESSLSPMRGTIPTSEITEEG